MKSEVSCLQGTVYLLHSGSHKSHASLINNTIGQKDTTTHPVRIVLRFCILLFIFQLLCSCTRSSQEREFPIGQLQEGDLAFRRGFGTLSRIVTFAEGSGTYSHVGIIVDDNGTWKIIHAVPGEREGENDFDRVKSEELQTFFSRNHAIHGCLVHTGFNQSAQIRDLCQKAIAAARDSVRFDDRYDLEDNSSVYCSEFVWKLYLEKGVDLSEGRRKQVDLPGLSKNIIFPDYLLEYSNNTVFHSF